MPARPIVKKKDGGGGGGSDSTRSSGRVPMKELEWSLRTLRKVDTGAQHFLQNYYDEDDDDDDGNSSDGSAILVDQSAYEIFKGKENFKQDANGHHSVWAALNAPLRTGIVDGRKVVFELLTNVTQRPTTSREERLSRSHYVMNSNKSNWEIRVRFWLMHFNVVRLSIIYFSIFILMNVLFAILFYYCDTRKCCNDSEFTFADVFNFSVQTSTTIGYGSFSPHGHVSNFLVAILSYTATLMNTLFAGLLFTKFVTPVINIQFSDVMTLCNVNGVPCLSIRLGNADGSYLNPLTDINVRLTYSYEIPYMDHKGVQKYFRQTEELRLLSNRQHGLKEIWTLRHVLDESSPLFGLNFEEHPGNKIYVFTLSIDAVQDLTKSSVNIQTEYALEDILIGHSFVSLELPVMISTEKKKRIINQDDSKTPIKSRTDILHDTNVGIISEDYSKMSDTEPYPVWYPAKAGAYAQDSTKSLMNSVRKMSSAYGP